MYGGIGVSASSLHRESTDSLIHTSYACSYIHVHKKCGLTQNEMSKYHKTWGIH